MIFSRQERLAPVLPQRCIQFQQKKGPLKSRRPERVWSLSISRNTILCVLISVFSNNLWMTFEIVVFVGSLVLSMNTLKTIQGDVDGMRKEREKLRIKLRNLDWEFTVASNDLKIAYERQQASIRAASMIEHKFDHEPHPRSS